MFHVRFRMSVQTRWIGQTLPSWSISTVCWLRWWLAAWMSWEQRQRKARMIGSTIPGLFHVGWNNDIALEAGTETGIYSAPTSRYCQASFYSLATYSKDWRLETWTGHWSLTCTRSVSSLWGQCLLWYIGLYLELFQGLSWLHVALKLEIRQRFQLNNWQ